MGKTMLLISAPIRIESEANRREHWRARWVRSQRQKRDMALALHLAGHPVPIPPVTVTLARVAPRALDSDNLAGGFKAVRDAIAEWMGVDDGPRGGVEWRYAQRSGRPHEYVVEVSIDG